MGVEMIDRNLGFLVEAPNKKIGCGPISHTTPLSQLF